MRRLEQRGAVAFAAMVVAVVVILLITLSGPPFLAALARLQPKLLHLRADPATSRHRKLAVSAIVRPWSISFLRSLKSASDQGSPSLRPSGCSWIGQLSAGDGVPPRPRPYATHTARHQGKRGLGVPISPQRTPLKSRRGILRVPNKSPAKERG